MHKFNDIVIRLNIMGEKQHPNSLLEIQNHFNKSIDRTKDQLASQMDVCTKKWIGGDIGGQTHEGKKREMGTLKTIDDLRKYTTQLSKNMSQDLMDLGMKAKMKT